MLASLGLEGLVLIIIMRAALGEMSPEMERVGAKEGKLLYLCRKGKPFASLNREQNLTPMHR